MKFIKDTENLIPRINSLEPRYLLEFLSLKQGLKKVLRIHIENNREYEDLKYYANSNNLLIGHSTFKLKISWQNELGDTFLENTDWSDPNAEQFVAYLSLDQKLLDKAVSIEVDEDHIDAGLLYGYPKCCCENYKIISEGKYWIDCLLENSKGLFFDYRTNKLAYLTNGFTLFPDYFNCSFHCTGTIDLSDKYKDIGDDYGLSELTSNIISCMKGLFLVHETNIIKFDNYIINHNCNDIDVSMDKVSIYGDRIDFSENRAIKLNIEDHNNDFYTYLKGIKYRVLVFE